MGTTMTDLEITKLCAQGMGYFVECAKYQPHSHVWVTPPHDEQSLPSQFFYQPLHNDAQAMALVKKFGLVCDPQHDGQDFGIDPGWEVSHPSLPDGYLSIHPDLNRAICECVAKMMQARAEIGRASCRERVYVLV